MIALSLAICGNKRMLPSSENPMSNQETTPRIDRRGGLSIGIGIGVGLITSKSVEKLLADSLGEWGAYGVAIIAAGLAAGIVALFVYTVMKPADGKSGKG